MTHLNLLIVLFPQQHVLARDQLLFTAIQQLQAVHLLLFKANEFFGQLAHFGLVLVVHLDAFLKDKYTEI